MLIKKNIQNIENFDENSSINIQSIRNVAITIDNGLDWIGLASLVMTSTEFLVQEATKMVWIRTLYKNKWVILLSGIYCSIIKFINRFSVFT